MGVKRFCDVVSGVWVVLAFGYACVIIAKATTFSIGILFGLFVFLCLSAVGLSFVWGLYYVGFWIADGFKKDDNKQDEQT